MVGEMTVLYRAFVLLNAVAATLAVLVGLRVAVSISNPFPTGFLSYYPVFFGLFGVVGLWRVVARPSPRARGRTRNDIIFLSAGILGAGLMMYAAQSYALPRSGVVWAGLLLLLSPVMIAILEISRRVPVAL